MCHVLVTGATGFIGSHLVEALLRQGHEVYCLVRDKTRLRWLNGLPVKVIEGDCKEVSSLKLPQVEVIYHLAGRVKAKRPVTFYQVNFYGTINLLKAIVRQRLKLKKFIFVSTLAVHGLPNIKVIRADDPPFAQTHYAKSKYLAEQAVMTYKDVFPVVILRPTAIYGPRDREFLGYLQCIKHGFAPVLNPEGILSFCYVKDLVGFLLAALEKEVPSGRVFLISDGQAYTWKEAVSVIAKQMQKRPLLLKPPKYLISFLAFITEGLSLFLDQPLIFSRDKLKEIFQKSWFCDISETCSLLGYTPRYDLKKGMQETIHWYKKEGWL